MKSVPVTSGVSVVMFAPWSWVGSSALGITPGRIRRIRTELDAGELGPGQLGNPVRGLDGDDLLERLTKPAEALGAVALGPPRLQFREQAEADALRLGAAFGQADQLGAAVERVGNALDIAA